MKRVCAYLQCVAFTAALFLPALTTTGQSAARRGGPEFVPNELLVQFRAGTSDVGIERALGRINAVAAEKVQDAFLHGQIKVNLFWPSFPA